MPGGGIPGRGGMPWGGNPGLGMKGGGPPASQLMSAIDEHKRLSFPLKSTVAERGVKQSWR